MGGSDRQLQTKAYAASLERAAKITTSHFMRNKRHLDDGPVIPEALSRLGNLPVDIPAGPPLVANDVTGEVEIPIEVSAGRLLVIGQVGLFAAYPFYEKYGAPMGSYTLVYEDGTTAETSIRNGIEVCSVLGIQVVSRIDPIATAAKRALKLVLDENYGIYYINVLELAAVPGRKIKCLKVCAKDPLCALAVYGVTAVL